MCMNFNVLNSVSLFLIRRTSWFEKLESNADKEYWHITMTQLYIIKTFTIFLLHLSLKFSSVQKLSSQSDI